jgi:hypothetical protein
MYNNSELGDGGSSIQVDTMPVASADNVGKIFQYVGETGTYKKGHFYECIWNRYDTTVYEWKAVDHFRFNHPVYSLNCEPVNSDFIAGDIIYYTGASTDKFKENHFYRALPDATKRAYYQAGFWFTESQATVYYAPVPFELRIGFIFTTSDQYPKPYQLTAVNEDGITITPYGWSGEPITYIGVTFPTTVQGWEELEGGGGTSIFYGTMDEWNALTTDEKKKYDYMTDNDEGHDKSATGVITRNTSNTSGMQEAYLKRIGKTVMLHCILMDCVLPANEITTYASVPYGFRPDSSLQWTMLDLDFTIEGLRGWITNSGNIQLLSPVATTSSIRIQSMYFTD